MNARLALKIDEASEPSNSALDDILHLAELGKLVVYVAARGGPAKLDNSLSDNLA